MKLDRTPLELLFFLAERAGTLVPREEAVEHVWGKEVFVESDSSLYTAVRKIRRVLDDDIGEPQFIQTVSRKGYRFIAPVEQVQALSPPTAGEPVSEAPIRASPRRAPWVLGTVLICVLATGITLVRAVRVHSPGGKIMQVVLPLENLSPDPQQEYLADGITEEITTELGSLDPNHLGVLARTSAMQYKHSPKTTAQISRELGVAYLLEGSIRRSDGSVRITARLIQSSDQTHLWAKSYDRELGDVLRVERDIAGLVAGEVRLRLPEQAHERLMETAQVNPEAHDAYLRGLQGWNQRSRKGFLQAITNFRRAAELDPNYAPTFAGLARVYSLSPIFAGIPASESAPKALEAANRALSLDETLADAHSAIAFVKGHYQFDWPAANREFRRAIELEPNNPYAHFFYSNSFLSPFRRHEEAIAEMKKAMQLDPLSLSIQSFAVRTFIWARRYGDALAQFQKGNQLDPNFALNHERVAQLYALLGKYDEAVQEETKARLLSGETPSDVLAHMNILRQAAVTRGAQGYRDTELQFSRGEQNPPEAYAHPYGLAIIYTHLGEIDKALANLELRIANAICR